MEYSIKTRKINRILFDMSTIWPIWKIYFNGTASIIRWFCSPLNHRNRPMLMLLCVCFFVVILAMIFSFNVIVSNRKNGKITVDEKCARFVILPNKNDGTRTLFQHTHRISRAHANSLKHIAWRWISDIQTFPELQFNNAVKSKLKTIWTFCLN